MRMACTVREVHKLVSVLCASAFTASWHVHRGRAGMLFDDIAVEHHVAICSEPMRLYGRSRIQYGRLDNLRVVQSQRPDPLHTSFQVSYHSASSNTPGMT